MSQLIKPKDKTALGLDLGTSNIKYVKLRPAKDGYELSSFGIETSQTDVTPILKKINQAQNINKANISLSAPQAIIRYVNFPRMQLVELKQALRFEAQKHIPFSVNEVNLDVIILKNDLPDNKMLVLLAAAKKDFINQRIKILTDLGITPSLIDVDALALVNAFNFSYAEDESVKNKTVALLNIGAAVSNLSILENGLPRLSRDINIAGNSFTQKLADVFAIDFKAAENLKLNPEKEKLEKISLSLENVLSGLATETRVSFDYYESQGLASVSKIFASGGISIFPGVTDTLKNLLDISVENWDPFKKISIPANMDAGKLKNSASQFAVAVGLALR